MENTKNEIYRLFVLLSKGIGITMDEIRSEIGCIYSGLRGMEAMGLLKQDQYKKWFLRHLPKEIFSYILKHDIVERWEILKHIEKNFGHSKEACIKVLKSMNEISLIKIEDKEIMINRGAVKLKVGTIKDELASEICSLLSKQPVKTSDIVSSLQGWGKQAVYTALMNLTTDGKIIRSEDSLYSLPGIVIQPEKEKKMKCANRRGMKMRTIIIDLIKKGFNTSSLLMREMKMIKPSITYHIRNMVSEGLLIKNGNYENCFYSLPIQESQGTDIHKDDSTTDVLNKGEESRKLILKTLEIEPMTIAQIREKDYRLSVGNIYQAGMKLVNDGLVKRCEGENGVFTYSLIKNTPVFQEKKVETSTQVSYDLQSSIQTMSSTLCTFVIERSESRAKVLAVNRLMKCLSCDREEAELIYDNQQNFSDTFKLLVDSRSKELARMSLVTQIGYTQEEAMSMIP